MTKSLGIVVLHQRQRTMLDGSTNGAGGQIPRLAVPRNHEQAACLQGRSGQWQRQRHFGGTCTLDLATAPGAERG